MKEEITSRLVWLGSSSRALEVGNTLSKLPDNVREWALEKLVWFCPPKDINGEAAIIGPGRVPMERYAEGRSGGSGGFWLNIRVVYIDPHVFEENDKFRHIIAHEIAHHWLRHSPGSAEEVAAMEVEADALAHKWLKPQPRKEIIMANEIALGMVKRGASALLIEAPTSGLEVHKEGVTLAR